MELTPKPEALEGSSSIAADSTLRGVMKELRVRETEEIMLHCSDGFPGDWQIVRVDDAFEIQQGKQVSRKNKIGENQRPFLRTKNVFWGRLDLEELDEMHFTESEEKRLTLQYGDLLLCEGGDVGRTAIWRNEMDRCYYQHHLHRLRANGSIEPEFALYWFWYAHEVGKVYFGRKNVTTIPNMSKSRLSELPIVCPPLPEQRKIAAILSTIQRAIEQQERLIALTTELKKALMYKLFTEGTRGEAQKQTEIGPMPESWVLVQGQDAFEIRQGQVDPKWRRSNAASRSENVEAGRAGLELQTNAELGISSETTISLRKMLSTRRSVRI